MKLFTHALRKAILGAVMAGLLMSGGSATAQTKNWKDQAEYDLYVSITKATVPDQQIQLLNQWQEKYPESDYKIERAQAFVTVYNKKNDAPGLYNAAKNLLALDSKSFIALYFLNLLTVSMDKKDPEGLEIGGKAANGLIGVLDTQFDPAKKPAAVAEEAWKKQRNDTEVQALKTLGWIEQQKKNYTGAEEYFTKALKINDQNAELSYFLGTVIVLQKKVERQSEAMWHFARAGNLEGAGAMAPAAKTQVAKYFERTFTAFAGDDKAAMGDVIKQATASVFPPAGFKLESKEEKMAKNEEKFKAENPTLFAYIQLKKGLLAADGAAYWENVKDSELPEFAGKIVGLKPETNPKEITLAIETADQPEVTLVMEKPLRGKADVGTELKFVGVAKEFVKEPFTLKMEVDNEKLKGWPVQAAAPKAPAARRPAAAGKKGKK